MSETCNMDTSPSTFLPVRVCLFDVDGLLINSEDIYTEIYDNTLHSYGKPSLSWSVKARQQSRGTDGTLRLLRWCDLPLTLEEWKAHTAAHRDLFRNSELMPGVHQLLHNLSNRTSPAIQLALATSASKSLFEIKTSHLQSISEAFPEPYRVFGDDMEMEDKRKKPAPDIFLLALERINAALERQGGGNPVKMEECLVFEDSIAGVEAARRAGMRVVWVPHPGLLDVCKGWEEAVLQGATEQQGGEVGPMVPRDGETGVKRDRLEDGWKSGDGWAELITSLEHFSYERYGIYLKL